MKLEYINCASVKKLTRSYKRRVATEFLIELNHHNSDILEKVLAATEQNVTLKAEHVTAAIKETADAAIATSNN